jgi:sugar/nucleoside kinase (ribokinase family)
VTAQAPTDGDRFDVVALGNALVDVLAHEDDEFVRAHGLERGAMVMADAVTSERIYAALGPATEMSGGSAANTVAGVASFGGRAAYVGKVRDDQLGKVFAHDLRAAGVHYDTPMAPDGPSTGRCLVVVTPDAHRTMCTYLGASSQLAPDDVDEALIASGRVVYLEGYLWDQPAAKAALAHAAGVARQAGARVAFTLSDPFCVDRHRAEFLDLLEHHVDVLFANDDEIRSLYEVDDFDAALQAVRGHCEIAALTRSEHGSVVASGDEVHVVSAQPADVVDTTGAGDLYAAGFLFGLTHGRGLAECGRLGSLAAAEVIAHLGARPQVSLADLAATPG